MGVTLLTGDPAKVGLMPPTILIWQRLQKVR
jgi:hypothetical protein